MAKAQFLDVNNLRISKRNYLGSMPVAIGIAGIGLIPEVNNGMDEQYTFAVFTKEDAQKIVDNLQKVIDSI